MRIQEVLNKTTQFFKEKQIPSARLDAELLIAKALGLQRIDLYLKFDQPLKENEVVACRELVRRRASGEPVAYIFQEKGFFGFDFFVDPRVLIPRPESEMLVENALEFIQKTDQLQIQVMDFGSGSGCLGLAILAKEPRARAMLVDRSADALAVAKINAERLGVSERSQFQEARVQDLQELPDGRVDVIVANPPYISPSDPDLHPHVKQFEPASALFGGASGMDEISAWIPVAFRALRPGGLLLMEIGMTQGEATKAEFQRNGFEGIEVLKDLAGLDRVVSGRKEIKNG